MLKWDPALIYLLCWNPKIRFFLTALLWSTQNLNSLLTQSYLRSDASLLLTMRSIATREAEDTFRKKVLGSVLILGYTKGENMKRNQRNMLYLELAKELRSKQI